MPEATQGVPWVGGAYLILRSTGNWLLHLGNGVLRDPAEVGLAGVQAHATSLLGLFADETYPGEAPLNAHTTGRG